MDVPFFESVEGTFEPEECLFGRSSQGRDHGKGRITRVTSWDALAVQLRDTLKTLGLPVVDLHKDGVFATQTTRVLVATLHLHQSDIRRSDCA